MVQAIPGSPSVTLCHRTAICDAGVTPVMCTSCGECLNWLRLMRAGVDEEIAHV